MKSGIRIESKNDTGLIRFSIVPPNADPYVVHFSLEQLQRMLANPPRKRFAAVMVRPELVDRMIGDLRSAADQIEKEFVASGAPLSIEERDLELLARDAIWEETE